MEELGAIEASVSSRFLLFWNDSVCCSVISVFGWNIKLSSL